METYQPILRLKVKHIGSNSLLGTVVDHLIKNARLNDYHKVKEIQFYIDDIIRGIDLNQEIKEVEKHFNMSVVKVYDIKTYDI